MDPFQSIFAGSMLFTIIIIAASCLFTVVMIAGTGFLIYYIMKRMGPNQSILQNGIPAQATIRQVWQTGTFINENPQVGMQLEVRPPGGAPYVTQLNAVVPLINIPQFQPGTVVPVKISPTDASKVELDVYGPRT
jgi:hypothetical protein